MVDFGDGRSSTGSDGEEDVECGGEGGGVRESFSRSDSLFAGVTATISSRSSAGALFISFALVIVFFSLLWKGCSLRFWWMMMMDRVLFSSVLSHETNENVLSPQLQLSVSFQ